MAAKGEIPSADELAHLIGERLAPPRVDAYEVAEVLGCHAGSVSRFENGHQRLPGGKGVDDYRAAVARLKKEKAKQKAVA